MPREKDSRLTEDQLIAAELLVYGATNKEVADQLDVCEKTIMRWKKRPEFMEELDRQYEVAKNKVDNRIMKFSNQLLQNILDLSRSAKSEKVRLDASIYLLNRLAGAPISKVETKTVITPETEKENNMFVLSVQDEGMGIPKNKLNYIYDRFYQVDKSRSSKISTGLGLSIVKKIVELNQGTIDVESTLGIGSTFTVKLPINPKVSHNEDTI